jgi:hypothetical protein
MRLLSLPLSPSSSAIGLISFLILVLTYNTLFGSSESNSRDENRNKVLPVVQHNISNNKGDSVYPQVASNSNSTFVVWQDNSVSDESSNYEILINRIDAGGILNNDPINLSNNSGFSEHPQIAVYQNYVYVVWADNTMSKNREVMLSVSRDGGKTFERAVNLSNDTGDSYNQEISLDKNNVYVVWQNTDKTEKSLVGRYGYTVESIIIQKSMDNGVIFDEPITLAIGTGTTSYPKVSTSNNGDVYVIWNAKSDNDTIKDGIFLKKSSDGGNTFDDATKLSGYMGSGESQVYASKDNDETVFVTWGGLVSSREVVNDLYLTKSNDTGTTFEVPSLIYDSLRNSLNPEIIEDNGIIIIASEDGMVLENGTRNEEIFLTASSDGGANFNELINISNNEGFSECPSLSVSDNGDLNIVWEDRTPGNNEVFSTKIKRSVLEQLDAYSPTLNTKTN